MTGEIRTLREVEQSLVERTAERREAVERRLAEPPEEETQGDDELTCPHCGTAHYDDLHELEDGDTFECSACGRKMTLGVFTTTTYVARPVVE